MLKFKNLDGQLTWFDRLTKAIVETVLIFGQVYEGIVLACCDSSRFEWDETTFNYCPLAKIWSWNR